MAVAARGMETTATVADVGTTLHDRKLTPKHEDLRVWEQYLQRYPANVSKSALTLSCHAQDPFLNILDTASNERLSKLAHVSCNWKAF